MTDIQNIQYTCLFFQPLLSLLTIKVTFLLFDSFVYISINNSISSVVKTCDLHFLHLKKLVL